MQQLVTGILKSKRNLLPDGAAFNILISKPAFIKPGINNIISNNPVTADATIITKSDQRGKPEFWE